MRCRGPRVEGSHQRVGCGADVSKLIEAVPRDGSEHTIQCEKCGNEIKVKKTLPSTHG